MDPSSNNPYLEIPDPFKQYRESLATLHLDNPKGIEMERLCYEVFIISKEGQKLYEHLIEKYLIPSQVSPAHPQGMQIAMYFEGFKAGLRSLMDMARIHQQRIAGANKT
jgi:hypothetical protein